MVYLLTVASALANALTSIFQRMGVEDAPEQDTMRLRLMTHALKQGVWLLGFGLMVASFLLQAFALHLGDLSQVQPVLTTELVFLVVILSVWFRFPVGRRQWFGFLAAAGGLAGFLASAQPGGGTATPDNVAWAAAGIVCSALALVAIILALRGPRWWRAAMFGVAAAIGYAFTAALTKSAGNYIAQDWTHMFVHWQTYGVAVAGLAALFLTQNSFHAGPIAASQTALVLVDPLVSLGLGIGLFGDDLRTSGVYGPLEAAALLVMCVGVASLAHSPLVAGVKGEDERYSELLSRRGRADSPEAAEPPERAVTPRR